MIKCITANIFRDHFGDCSNGGLSSKVNEVYVPCEDGHIDVDDNNPYLVRIVVRDLGFGTHIHAEPVAEVPKGNVGYMMGGTFIYSSDSRFHKLFDYPIPLHDRTETQEQYDALSR